jgi:hypothetical protein
MLLINRPVFAPLVAQVIAGVKLRAGLSAGYSESSARFSFADMRYWPELSRIAIDYVVMIVSDPYTSDPRADRYRI